ncbi:hypothetical protein E0L93_08520 [Rubrobacter taiwanensis]|uniref:Uncharacterized protein n=1 Tax=Rubrobacter taiwanensis TaxID=185139 RepID=A0A4R1BHZ6_9ACTN|nr:hypothetical protein [Rubrobacter taiwanensis]TCJ16758.1 hypothetical protein E0L93_08520 [Rubrobacter taiwanensis]
MARYLHGIKCDLEGAPNPSSIRNIRKIVVRYADGGEMHFEPEPGLDSLGEDEILELSKIFFKAAERVEWAEHTGKG